MSGNIAVGIAAGAVFLVLCLGLYSLYRGGEYARSNSNKLMRLRVGLQFLAIVVIMTVLWFREG
jgi:Hypoxia induced protein conserved region